MASMSDRHQFQIIQDVVSTVLSHVEDGWKQLVIDYHVDDRRCNFHNSYLIDVDGGEKEKFLSSPNGLDPLLRELRNHLAHSGGEKFSSCRLHLWWDGKFDAKYGFGKVDWRALMLVSGGNFKSN